MLLVSPSGNIYNCIKRLLELFWENSRELFWQRAPSYTCDKVLNNCLNSNVRKTTSLCRCFPALCINIEIKVVPFGFLYSKLWTQSLHSSSFVIAHGQLVIFDFRQVFQGCILTNFFPVFANVPVFYA